MRELDTYGSIQNGKLHISYKDKFLESLKLFTTKQDQVVRVIVTVKKLYRKRSNPQNAYYWGVVINEFCLGFNDTQGEDCEPEDAHYFLKQQFNYKEIYDKKTGEVLKIGKTTTNSTTIEFEEYLESCRRFIQEWFGRTVPLPNEQTELFT